MIRSAFKIEEKMTQNQDSTLKEEQWSKGIAFEVGFWETWVKSGGSEWPADYQKRLDPEMPLVEYMAAHCESLNKPKLRILDVGAGPMTLVGKKLGNKILEIVAIDPLAEQYNILLDEKGIKPLVRTQFGYGEKILEYFPKGSFDVAHAQNSLDHGMNPVQSIEQMVEVVGSPGFVFLSHAENEGKTANYGGFHQWDFTEKNGDFLVIGRNGNETNITRMLAPKAQVKTTRSEAGWIQVVISKP